MSYYDWSRSRMVWYSRCTNWIASSALFFSNSFILASAKPFTRSDSSLGLP